MKNKVFILLASLLLISVSLFAQGANEVTSNDYIVRVESIENIDGGIAILGVEENLDKIIINVEGGVEGLKLGDIILARTNGITTRSLPAQTTALEVEIITQAVEMGIYSYDAPVVDTVLMRKEVKVLDVFTDNGLSFLVQAESEAPYILNTDENTVSATDLNTIQKGYILAVQDNGIMTLNIPGETYALSILVVSDEVAITKDVKVLDVFTENGLSFLVLGADKVPYVLIVDENTVSSSNLTTIKAGYTLNVQDNGIMTASIPGQTYAVSIEITSDLSVEDKFNYVFGYESVSQFLSQGMIIKATPFVKAVLDYATQTINLSVDEINEAIQTVGKDLTSVTLADAAEDAIPSLQSAFKYSLTDSLIDRFSYSIGIYIVNEYARQGFGLSAVNFANGVIAAICELEADYPEEERTQILQDYISYLEAQMIEELNQRASANLKAAEDFLATNKTVSGVVTTPSGLQYLVLKEGNGAMANENSKCKLNYVLTDLSGNVLNSGNAVTLDISQTVLGFKEAVMSVPVGSSVIAYLHPDLGYGFNAPPKFGPNSLLIFEIELLEIVE